MKEQVEDSDEGEEEEIDKEEGAKAFSKDWLPSKQAHGSVNLILTSPYHTQDVLSFLVLHPITLYLI